jgi:hypothetical protein
MTSTKQAYEWVKTGHWSWRQLNEWVNETPAQPADPTGQAPCAKHCEATAFQIVIKNLRGEIERLKAPQRTEQEPMAWDLADKVRKDLDRKSCPDAFMRIAVESIVKHHPAQPPQHTEQGDKHD